MALKESSRELSSIMNEITTTQDPIARREESQSIMEALKELEQF